MAWDYPKRCGNRHAIVPGNMKYSWVQCRCPKAIKPSKGPAGHDYVACTTCWWEARENNCDELVDGRPVSGSGR